MLTPDMRDIIPPWDIIPVVGYQPCCKQIYPQMPPKRTILDCEKSTILICFCCPQVCIHISKTHNQSFSCLWNIWYEDDWKDSVTGDYHFTFIQNLHEHVLNMLSTTTNELENVTPDTRVILVRLWADGFEAHKIKAKNNFNNLQLFTLTVLAEPGKNIRNHTSPLALCHKKKNHHDLFIKILGEVTALQTPKLRYWGAEKQPIKIIVFLEMISNDLPERCSNTCTTRKLYPQMEIFL